MLVSTGAKKGQWNALVEEAAEANEVCPPGKERTGVAGAYICVACTGGKYSDEDSKSDSCKDCAVGTYSLGTGAVRCAHCPAGYSQNEVGVEYCEQCHGGKYQNLPQQATCEDCVVCGAGQYAQSDCQNDRNTVCQNCAKGTFSADGASCIQCAVGMFADSEGESACQP